MIKQTLLLAKEKATAGLRPWSTVVYLSLGPMDRNDVVYQDGDVANATFKTIPRKFEKKIKAFID